MNADEMHVEAQAFDGGGWGGVSYLQSENMLPIAMRQICPMECIIVC